MVRIIFLICIAALTCGFTVREPRESRFSRSGDMTPQTWGPRSMQSDDLLWKNFAQCKIKRDQDYSYSITYIPGVRAMNGKEITISGFMLPLEAKEKFNHFLLSRRAPTCAFCPPGEPNEIVEVFSAKPMMWEENLVTVSGTLILVNDGKKGIFFRMKDAVGR